ncbi:hypothetical protein J1614_012066 [Plenodomus biglobosus]|nr:hypothetical protein J1614_012066 [Plenodomus biglobosus]
MRRAQQKLRCGGDGRAVEDREAARWPRPMPGSTAMGRPGWNATSLAGHGRGEAASWSRANGSASRLVGGGQSTAHSYTVQRPLGVWKRAVSAPPGAAARRRSRSGSVAASRNVGEFGVEGWCCR